MSATGTLIKFLTIVAPRFPKAKECEAIALLEALRWIGSVGCEIVIIENILIDERQCNEVWRLASGEFHHGEKQSLETSSESCSSHRCYDMNLCLFDAQTLILRQMEKNTRKKNVP
ncbi:hypothetical protein LINPERPRIM_LOCUS7707 [Linum perenne]